MNNLFQPNLVLSHAASALVTHDALTRYGQLASGTLSLTKRSSPERFRELNQMTPSSIVGDVKNNSLAACCLSGIWLLFGYLDQSHDISQNIKSQEGSFWHGIMHRLESDFWNSKYWYRNVGNHPVITTLQQNQADYYPFDFVDDCELATEQGDTAAAQRVEAMAIEEWKSLFQFCYTNAT